MALIPLIQPPIMRLLTTKKEREVKMEQLRQVSKTEKIVFPIAVAIIVILLIPDTAPLIGMLMLGNLLRECGVTDRLERHRAERAVQHRHHLPRSVGRLQGDCVHLPDLGDHQDHHPRPDRVHVLDRRRPAVRQGYV